MHFEALAFFNAFGKEIYEMMMLYVGLYPTFGGILLIVTSSIYWLRRERDRYNMELKEFPKVSVVIAARNEEKDIANCIDSLLKMDYPDFEIMVINDGSTDNTEQILQKYVEEGKIRLANKDKNQGKAVAINDVARSLNGDIFLILDADAEVIPNILTRMVPHFSRGRTAAVAGNPIVKNPRNFLGCMQYVEYISIIGMIRRTQRVWGRIMAMSGVVFAIRKDAFFDVGGFTPSAATEDIDITWKLQRRFWDIVFDSKAIALVKVPTTYYAFFKQRLRWSRGLMNVLHRYWNTLFCWKYRRMWAVVIDNIFSILWAFCFAVLTILWVITLIFGFKTYGTTPLPQAWGMSIATVTLFLCFTAYFFNAYRRRSIMRYFFYVIYYPIYYWILLAFIAVLSMPSLFVKPKNNSSWKTER